MTSNDVCLTSLGQGCVCLGQSLLVKTYPYVCCGKWLLPASSHWRGHYTPYVATCMYVCDGLCGILAHIRLAVICSGSKLS